MAMKCQICAKGPSVGHTISHSNIKTLRRFNPNLLRKRFEADDGSVVYLKICTACLRTLVKPPRIRAPRKGAKGRPAPKTAKAKAA